jgi:serine/threonine protein phosphatase PrpC
MHIMTGEAKAARALLLDTEIARILRDATPRQGYLRPSDAEVTAIKLRALPVAEGSAGAAQQLPLPAAGGASALFQLMHHQVQGPRRRQEDAMFCNGSRHMKWSAHVMGVCDGLGGESNGREAAVAAARELERLICGGGTPWGRADWPPGHMLPWVPDHMPGQESDASVLDISLLEYMANSRRTYGTYSLYPVESVRRLKSIQDVCHLADKAAREVGGSTTVSLANWVTCPAPTPSALNGVLAQQVGWATSGMIVTAHAGDSAVVVLQRERRTGCLYWYLPCHPETGYQGWYDASGADPNKQVGGSPEYFRNMLTNFLGYSSDTRYKREVRQVSGIWTYAEVDTLVVCATDGAFDRFERTDANGRIWLNVAAMVRYLLEPFIREGEDYSCAAETAKVVDSHLNALAAQSHDNTSVSMALITDGIQWQPRDAVHRRAFAADPKVPDSISEIAGCGSAWQENFVSAAALRNTLEEFYRGLLTAEACGQPGCMLL